MTYREFMQQAREGKYSKEEILEMLSEDNFDYEVQYYDIGDFFMTYDLFSNNFEDYFLENYGKEVMPYDDWERLASFECARHPEWMQAC